MPLPADDWPKEFVLPDWESNVLSLIRAIMDPARHAGFMERLQIGDPRILVLLLIDGMNRREVEAHCEIGNDLRRDFRLTSLAPSGTAPVITSLATGVAPREHGATGWITWCREVGAMILPLPFTYQAGGDLASCGHSPERLLYRGPSAFEEIAEKTGRECFQIMPRGVAASAFTGRMQRGAKVFPFAGLPHLFETVEWLVRALAAAKSRTAFIYAYTDALDQTQHRFGIADPNTRRAYAEIGRELKKLALSLKGQDVGVLALSDHGFVDSPPEEAVFLHDHPALASTLRLPLSGEARFAYCHLKPGMEGAFLDYVRNGLSGKFFPIATSESRICELFGVGPEHKEFRERIGDYILASRGGAAIHDPLANEPLKAFRGLHGSLLEEEMLIPLILIRP